MTRQDAAVWPALLECRERALRVALARGVSPDDLDDVVQEAMARVAGMQRVDTTRVGALLSVVVANLVVDRQRAASAAVRLERRLAAAALTAGPPPPDEAVCDRDEARWLWQRARQLTEQDRRVLKLRADGFSVAATAAELGITCKAAENAFARARSRMHTVWRSAMAVIAVTWARILGRPRAASELVAVALATTLVLIAVPWRDYWSPPSPSNGSALQARLHSGPQEVRRLSIPASVSGRQSTAQTSRRRISRPVQPPGVADTGPIHMARLGTRGARVDQRHAEETLPQTLERCLRKGVAITPHKIGCNP